MSLFRRGPKPPEKTSQEVFATMMKVTVAPALRTMGFKGSGQAFSIPDDVYWMIVGFQKSAFSDRMRLKFTINLTVVSKQAWAEYRKQSSRDGDRPSPNVKYGTFAWQKRIGSLMPSGDDYWWWIESDSDPAALADEVIAAMRDHGLPAMRAATSS